MIKNSNTNEYSIFVNLPFDIIKEILLYDSHFVLRNKRLIFIDKIPKSDFRFKLYNSIPKVYELAPNSWSVIFSEKEKRYVLRHYLRPTQIWEYSFVVYSKDPHMNIMNTIPDTMIYIPLFKEHFQ
jgi:hypothetical protein